MMTSVDLFSNTVTSPVSPIQTADIESMLTMDNGILPVVDALTINDIKMFESLDSSGSSGIGNSNEAIIEGSLDEADSLHEDASQYCKICE